MSLDAVRKIHVDGIPLRLNNGSILVDRQYVTNYYTSWIVDTGILPSYDVFISHRWYNDAPDVVASQLYDALLGFHTVDRENRAVQVFLDKIRLKDGMQFQTEFGPALISSTVFVPILSASALQRMLTHDPLKEDNVLIEWMLALECISDKSHSNIRGIYPLMIGERREDGSVGNLFAEGLTDRLPEIEPSKSIEVVKRLLKENGVNASPMLSIRTVRRVVKDLSNFNGMLCWKEPLNTYVRTSSCKITELVAQCSTAACWILPSYDVFISHRWYSDTPDVARQLFDTLLGYTVCSENRAIRVFLDKIRVNKGLQYPGAIGKALINSAVFVPILSTSALQRILTHNPDAKDNLLIEWMLALECMLDPINSKMRRINPLMFGEIKEDGSVGDLFAESVIDELPDIIPTSSIAVVETLLEEHGIKVRRPFLHNRTVSNIVQDVAKHVGLKCWEEPSNAYIVNASNRIVEILSDISLPDSQLKRINTTPNESNDDKTSLPAESTLDGPTGI